MRRGRCGLLGHPVIIPPLVGAEVDHQRRGPRRNFRTKSIGIAAVVKRPAGMNPVFVEGASPQAGDKEFPNPSGEPPLHPLGTSLPVVEVPHDLDQFGIRRPDGEVHTGDPVD